MTTAMPARRRSRFWLYAPFVALALAGAVWVGFWFVVRARVGEAIDTALAREQQLGRSWTCADRSISGFPFRIEVRCATLALTSTRWGEAVRIDTGPAVAIGQIYAPGLVIAQVTGPLKAALPEGRALDLGWSRFEASLATQAGEPQRLSLVMAEPKAALAAPGLANETWAATQLEAHWRRNEARAAEQAADIAVAIKGSVLPALDALLGTREAGDVDLQTSITFTDAFRLGFNPDALEAWRNAGGQVELTKLTSVKGKARIEATGRLQLDQTHRLSGQLQAGVAGIDQIGGFRLGGLMGGLGSLGNLGGLGGLLGGRLTAPAPNAPGAASGLTPLPPVVLREGRVYLGPIRLPLAPLAPLY